MSSGFLAIYIFIPTLCCQTVNWTIFLRLCEVQVQQKEGGEEEEDIQVKVKLEQKVLQEGGEEKEEEEEEPKIQMEVKVEPKVLDEEGEEEEEEVEE